MGCSFCNSSTPRACGLRREKNTNKPIADAASASEKRGRKKNQATLMVSSDNTALSTRDTMVRPKEATFERKFPMRGTDPSTIAIAAHKTNHKGMQSTSAQKLPPHCSTYTHAAAACERPGTS